MLVKAAAVLDGSMLNEYEESVDAAVYAAALFADVDEVFR